MATYYTAEKQKNVWISSDFHAFHKNLVAGCTNWEDKAGCRNFQDQNIMTEVMADNINSVVESQDVLIHLGDWSLSYDKLERKWEGQYNASWTLSS